MKAVLFSTRGRISKPPWPPSWDNAVRSSALSNCQGIEFNPNLILIWDVIHPDFRRPTPYALRRILSPRLRYRKQRVAVKGLVKAAHHNGKEGCVRDFLEEMGRYQVS